MAKASNTVNGKAFEYACLTALHDRIYAATRDVSIIQSAAYNTAHKSYCSLGSNMQNDLMMAANTAADLLLPLEPRLIGGKGTLMLDIAADAIAIGANGDVRDVLCIRTAEDPEWTIGISCKHNHEALRHPRITEGMDFGKDWLGIPCSAAYMAAMTPIINTLVSYGQRSILWRTIPAKQDRYYVPILQAYIDEIQRLCNSHPDAPAKMLSYFFGSNDFYKVIMHSSAKTTTIEGFNLRGTLNAPCGRTRAMTRIPLTKMPSRLYDASFKTTKSGTSKTTIVLTFDAGWTVSMRLHNKDKIASPTSLAWDVQLAGLPPTTYINTHSWFE